MTMLEMAAVKVRRGGFAVLDGIDLRIGEGELVCILGRNGAGKTTLVEAIAGLLKPASGRIALEGTDVAGRPAHEIAARGVALVPEGRRLFVNMTVLENLAVGAHAAKWWWGGPPAGALDIVWRLFPDLEEMRHRRVTALSGGQQQMVAIGRALASNPRLLVLDEPSFGLSPQMVEATCEHLTTLREAGTSILLVEQNVDVALEVCTRAAVLADGLIAAEGPLDELVGTQLFETAMFGRAAGSTEAPVSAATSERRVR
jgi:branched-chain amino acid transport system ATP-binding protein